MHRTALVLFSGLLATSAISCTDATDATSQGVVNDEDPLLSSNGLSSNGLSSNGLSSNGLSSNGLSSNGLISNGLTSNTLVMQALRDQSATGDLTRLFFRYLISCALPTGHSVSYTWTDSSNTLHTEVNPGGLGLAPGWESGAATEDDKEIVSACLGSRTNSKGIPVPISMRSKNVNALAVSSDERTSYSYGEGAFWGNLFNGGHPYIYSCSRAAFSEGSKTSQYLSQGRTCTVTACGIITPVGPCYAADGASSGQACYDRPSNYDWVGSCDPEMKKSASDISTHVISTWLMP
jgi:hypothetical protein